MDFFEIVNLVLPVVYVVVGIALIWFVVELVVTVRKTRETVTSVQKQIEPTLEHVEKITASLEPVCDKVDPLIDRVSLTVDAANLEVMRLDQILEDVSDITSSASSAVNAVDTVTNAPIELVNSVTKKVRHAFKPKKASDESAALGQGDVDPNPVSDLVDATAEAVSAGARRVTGKVSSREERQEQPGEEASSDADKHSVTVEPADNTEDKYFTYSAEALEGAETLKE